MEALDVAIFPASVGFSSMEGQRVRVSSFFFLLRCFLKLTLPRY